MSLCSIDGCRLRARYNYPNETQPIMCYHHLTTNMVLFAVNNNDVVIPPQRRIRYCNYLDCYIKPSYGFVNDQIPLKCSIHRSDEMVRINRHN